MKKQICWTAALSVIVLSACSQTVNTLAPAIDPTKPKLTTDGKLITIDQPILGFKLGNAPVDTPITWSLPAGGKFHFVADKGIVIEGRLTDQVLYGSQTSVVLDTTQTEIGQCKADPTGFNYSCINKLSRRGVFKYTIRITDGNVTIELDPVAANW